MGLNVFLWCFVIPNFLIALKWSLVPYPTFLSQEYFVNFLDILLTNRSLETLAIIDAAEISGIFSSPLTIFFNL